MSMKKTSRNGKRSSQSYRRRKSLKGGASIRRKSIRRKSLKRKSLKRKSLKRKSSKRKSIRRNSLKRKSLRKKSFEKRGGLRWDQCQNESLNTTECIDCCDDIIHSSTGPRNTWPWDEYHQCVDDCTANMSNSDSSQYDSNSDSSGSSGYNSYHSNY